MTATQAETFRDVLAEYIPKNSKFYKNLCDTYDALAQVREQGAEHGIGVIVKSHEGPTPVDRYMRNTVPYNGTLHNIRDKDITDVMHDKQTMDGALVMDTNGYILRAGLSMPQDIPEYQDHFGIEAHIAEFLDFDVAVEGPVGTRVQSSLYASHKFGNHVAILTLGEGGEINLYYCGDRLYNSAGREMHWELAERMPSTRSKVIPLRPEYAHSVRPYSEPPSSEAAAGGMG